nr:hypothetical protein [Nanoarchaeum sp.]
MEIHKKRFVYVGLSISLVLIILLFLNYTGYAVLDEKNYNFNELPDMFELQKGQELILDLNFEEGYSFSDDSNIVDINKENGKLIFKSDEIGEYSVVLIALKDVSNFEYKLVKFRVIE